MRRGQATVELALGLTLLVPVLLLGWAFYESGQTSLKVAEAADSALWDSTSDRRPGFGDAYAASAAGRYADFDGRSRTSGSRQVRGARSTSDRLDVQCTATSVAITQPPFYDAVLPPSRARSCTATAETRLFGGFTRTHCSVGRPAGIGGPCRGAPGLALDDGALLDHRECRVSMNGGACENTEYFDKVEDLMMRAGPPSMAPVTLVRSTLLELPPYAATALDTYLSYRGEEAANPFSEDVPYPGDGEFPRWHTTPFDTHPQYREAYDLRTSCHLGLECAGGAIDDP
ncbi:MAG: hypothetical protein JNK82_31175 [Myxococcaceae bacterium]|nr:hypothetical protein [Myxococcaceae bacterium]